MAGARILLTGGTGFLGRQVRAALEARGDEVVVVSRGGPVGWDHVEAEVGRADAVIHLAGESVAAARWTPERLALIRSSRTETTARVAAAIGAAQRKPRVLLSASAVGIYGMRTDDATCDEGAPPGDDELARICVAWEEAAQPARAAGVRVVHPRIGVVLGRGGALEQMRRPFEWFVGGRVGSGRQWLSWIHARDVVGALLWMLDREELSGPVNVVAPEAARMADLAAALGEVLRRPALLPVPAFALRLALGEGLARMLLTGQRVVPSKLLGSGFAFELPDLREALRDLR